MRILIVDDSRAMLAIVKRIILDAGLHHVEVQTAQNGEAGLEVFQTFLPDLVLSDWHMPGISGLEMLYSIRQMAGHPVRFGFITTESQPTALADAKRAGATFVLNKPFKDEELKANLLAIDRNLRETAAQVDLVDQARLEVILRAGLNGVPFRLVARPVVLQDLSPENLLALFGAGESQQLSVVAVMDTVSLLMLGAASKRLPPHSAKYAMTLLKASPADVEVAVGLLRASTAAFNPAYLEQPILHRYSLVSKGLPKLQELMRSHRRQSSFRLDIPGYGSGRFAFIQV